MERRVTSHTEEEEMNQRRRLLTQARKGDQKAVEQLFELYQVKVFSGDSLKRKKLPTFPAQKTQVVVPKGSYAPEKKEKKSPLKEISRSGKKGRREQPKKTKDQRKKTGQAKSGLPKGAKKKPLGMPKAKPPTKKSSLRLVGGPSKKYSKASSKTSKARVSKVSKVRSKPAKKK